MITTRGRGARKTSLSLSPSLHHSLGISLALSIGVAVQNKHEVILVCTREGELWMYNCKNWFMVAQDEAHDNGRMGEEEERPASEAMFSVSTGAGAAVASASASRRTLSNCSALSLNASAFPSSREFCPLQR